MASFGSSGVRGPFATVATPEFALRIGRAVGAMRRRVVVGRDARVTGPLLERALVAGLLAQGAEVATCGVLPTPALAYAARRHEAGIVVTASHNPAPDNGFKLWEPTGKAFGKAERAHVERLLAAPPESAAWDAVGRAEEEPGAIEAHVARILDITGPLPRPLRVVLDCGNGAASRESPLLLRKLGCDVVTLNAQPDGHFPGRPSEPSEENLAALRQAVVAAGADLGLAHDGDADRCMAVTASGRYVQGDELLLLFAQEQKGKTIACPVDASRTIEDASGCRVVRTRVGDAYVSEALAEARGAFGGEASGAWIFPEMSYCPDGPLAAALACRMVAARGPLDALVEALPRYPLWRHSWRMRPEEIAPTMQRFAEGLAEGKVTTLDGVKADYDEGWVLVRPSGTEPKVRVTVEARDAAGLERLKAKVARVKAL
ncbi:MAG: phosphoglucosamine mutase [Thermoplasmata archaeon]|jgi:phosphoglucosamine mutase|nr:phosphoglucosamine mutase [Thermoplasmata archaeon]